MNKSDKLIKKTVPRLIAVLLAIIAGLGLFVFNRYVVFKPDSKKNENIKFIVPGKKDKKNNKEEEEDLSYKYSENSYNFLVMGHDRVADLTDVIMIINYDIEKQAVTIMQFPRDTYFRIGEYYYHKINGLYTYFVQEAEAAGVENPDLEGLKNTAGFFEENLAIKIHYSAVMDLDGFSGIVEAIGGVDMDVPMDMQYVDTEQVPPLYINLSKGYQHLDGNKAEQFVRYRYGYITGDYGRQDAQKLFISAFINKLKISITDSATIAALAKNLVTYVDTDVTDADIVYFGKCFLGISKGDAVQMENIKLFSMPGCDTMWETASMYCMNREYMADLMNEYYNIYDFDIHESFDANNVFVTPYQSEISEIYYAPKEYAIFTEYNAGGLQEGGLDG